VSAGPTRLRPRPPLLVREPAGLNARFRARRRSLRRKRWLRLGIPVLLVALLAGAAWVVLASSFMAVTTIKVSGTHRTSAALVELTAAVADGTPLARVDLVAVEHRVEQLTVVKSAVVTRSWPHTVVITVVERTPVAVAQSAAGHWELLDAEGVDLAGVSRRPPGLPLVALDPATADKNTLRAAAAVASALPPSLRAKVKDVTAATPDSVQLDLADGGLVRWGSAQDDALKAKVLGVLLTHRARVYDVTAPGFATTS
jgi:cell division protein FtsQ